MLLSPLLARAQNSTEVDISCPRPIKDDVGEPLFGNTTFHQLMIYICGPCLAVTFISSYYLCWTHLRHWTAPLEQRQILRIVVLPIFYCAFNFLAIVFLPQSYIYIEPWAGMIEGFAVAALFLLVLEYAAPDGTNREKFFDQLPLRSRYRGRELPGGSLKWYIITYGTVMQYPLTKTIFTIIQVVTQYYGDYCQSSWSPKHAHLYLYLGELLLIGGALGACVRFFRRFRKDIDSVHRPRGKVRSFIGIVAFQIVQDLIFHLLNSKLFTPSAKITYNDINYGIPSLLTCTESVIFSLIFQWSFSAGEFKDGVRSDRYGLGAAAKRQSTAKAILDAMNISDIIIAVAQGFVYIYQRWRSTLTRKPIQRRRTFKDNSGVMEEHLEPLSNISSGESGSGAPGNYYDHESQAFDVANTRYDGPIAVPMTAQDPTMGGRAQTFRADDELRPGGRVVGGGSRGYNRLEDRSRSPSQERIPRQMV